VDRQITPLAKGCRCLRPDRWVLIGEELR